MTDNSLTILLGQRDFRCVSANLPDASDGWILVMDADLHIHLTEIGVRHLTPWDVISGSDLTSLDRYRDDLVAFWQSIKIPAYRGMDAMRLASFRHHVCLTRMAWFAFVIERALQHCRATRLVTLREPEGHGLDQDQLGGSEYPVLFMLARGIALRHGLEVTAIDRDGANAQFVDRVAQHASSALPQVDVNESLRDRPYVLFYGNGGDQRRMLPVMTSIRDAGELLPVHVYKSGDPKTIRFVSREIPNTWHETQIANRNDDPSKAQWLSECRSAFDSACRSCPDTVANVFQNPYLDPHFDFMFGTYLDRMAWHVRAWQDFFRSHPPAMIVSAYPHPILDIAASSDIPGLILPHGAGALLLTTMYKSLPDSFTIGTLSPYHRNRLEEAGITTDRIALTGDPTAGIMASHARRSEPTCVRSSISVLFVTSNNGLPTGDFPHGDWKQAAIDWSDGVAPMIRRHPDWTFAVKRHPRYDYEPLYYERINRELPTNQQLTLYADEPLESLVDGFDVIVILNTATSAAFEAALFDRPVIICGPSQTWFPPERWGAEAFPIAATIDDLESMLAQVAADPTTYESALQTTRHAVSSYFGDCPEKSVTRCVDRIHRSAHTPPR